MIFITDFKSSETTQLVSCQFFPPLLSAESTARSPQDLLSCTAGSQHTSRRWQSTNVNLTNLVQHAVCNYFLLSWCFFFQPIFNLIYTLVRILPLERIASPQAFHYAVAAAVIFVTEKQISPSVTMRFESQLINISCLEIWLLYFFFLKGVKVRAKPYSLFHASLQCNSRP